MTRLRRLGPVLPIALLGLCACAPELPTEHSAGSAALRLFELAGVDEPTDLQLAAVFDPVPDTDGRGALLDELSGLAGTVSTVVVGVQSFAGADDAYVDVAAALPGGGEALFNVRLRRLPTPPGEAPEWRVTWFQGPGTEWPGAGGRGDGLSNSARPGDARH